MPREMLSMSSEAIAKRKAEMEKFSGPSAESEPEKKRQIISMVPEDVAKRKAEIEKESGPSVELEPDRKRQIIGPDYVEPEADRLVREGMERQMETDPKYKEMQERADRQEQAEKTILRKKSLVNRLIDMEKIRETEAKLGAPSTPEKEAGYNAGVKEIQDEIDAMNKIETVD